MRDKNTAAIIALLLGGIGGHKFYLGQTGMGLIYLLFCWTFIPAVIAFIECLMLVSMNQATFNARFNPGLALAAPAQQNIVVNVAQHSGGADVMSQIKQLHDLKVAGALSEEEFAQEKQKLLSGRS
jgi:TM2 domain-containing membrane protein YozV